MNGAYGTVVVYAPFSFPPATTEPALLRTEGVRRSRRRESTPKVTDRIEHGCEDSVGCWRETLIGIKLFLLGILQDAVSSPSQPGFDGE
jgi:hypothetical protein